MNSFIENLKQHKQTIFFSTLTGLFIFYHQQILSFIGQKGVSFLLLVSDGFNFYYYSLLSQNNPYIFDSITNYFIIASWVIGMFFLVKKIADKKYELKKSNSTNLNKISELKSVISGENPPISRDQISIELEEMEQQSLKIKNTLTKKNTNLIALTIIFIFFSIFLFSNYFISSIITSKQVKFKNKIILLKPYLSEKEVLKLESDWVNIKCDNDFSNIQGKLTELEKTHLKK